MSVRSNKNRKHLPQASLGNVEGDPSHHLIGPFLPQTPLDSPTPERGSTPVSDNSSSFYAQRVHRSVFVRWAIDPYASLKILLVPIVLYIGCELLMLAGVGTDISNPFGHIFLLSGHLDDSAVEDPRYRKTWWDLAFLAYYVVFFSFVREYLSAKVSRPLARFFGLKREGKIDRFAEQMYAFFYFMVFGAWGFRIMSQLPTYWYKTEEFWLGYPHWDLKPELKRYYLMQFAYWWQQLLVLVLGLEKPRSDYRELVVHHFVTLWLVGGSYIFNATYIGNAVFMSMDIPDCFFALAKLFNYIQWNVIKMYSFGAFVLIWSYFRHYLNFWILWSVWVEQPKLISEWTRHWKPSMGVYMPGWMRLQIFLPLSLLQLLNLFWYYLIWKILIRGLITSEVDDDRSDDESGDENDQHSQPTARSNKKKQ